MYCIMTEEFVIIGELAGERTLGKVMIIRTILLEITTNNTRRVKDCKEVVQEEKERRGQLCLRNDWLSTRPSFLDTFVKMRRVQGERLIAVLFLSPCTSYKLEYSSW